MTVKPTLQAARSDGYVVTAPDWNTNILQEGNYALEVAAGTNTDKIAIGSIPGVQGYYDNLLVNGGFEIWQRGAGPFTSGVCADRWGIAIGGSSTLSVSQGAATNPNSKYMASGTYTHAVGGSAVLTQHVENYSEYAGRTITACVLLFTAS